MFCKKCGFQISDASKYCMQCGEKVLVVANNGECSQASTSSLDSIGPSPSHSYAESGVSFRKFISFYKAKEQDRSRNLSKKGKNKMIMKSPSVVKISVGLMRNNIPVRSSCIQVRVSTDATAADVVEAAVRQMSFHLAGFNKDGTYILRYPDGMPIFFLPKSEDFFSLEGYKRQLDIDYDKVILFMTCEDPEILDTVDYYDYERDNLPEVTFITNGSNSSDCHVPVSTDEVDESLNTSDHQSSVQSTFENAVDDQLENFLSDNDDISMKSALQVSLADKSSKENDFLSVVCSKQMSSVVFSTCGIQHISTQVHTVGSYSATTPLENHDDSIHFNLGAEEGVSLTDILQRLAKSIDRNGGHNIVNVCRDDVLNCAMRAMSRRFNPLHPLHVKFCGEEGIDTRGLSREFMRLSVSAIQISSIFHGKDNQKFIRLDYKEMTACLSLMTQLRSMLSIVALTDRKYEFYGRLLAYCMVHNGPMPTFLHRQLYTAIAEGYARSKPSLDDLCDVDPDIYSKLKQISDAKDDDQFRAAVDAIEDVIHSSGCSSLAMSLHKKDNLLSSVCHYVLIGRNIMAIEQFKVGLSTLGVLQATQHHPVAMQKAFVFSPSRLDATMMDNLFSLISWSRTGSNRVAAERRVLAYWRDFLQDLEEREQLDQLLIFVTGSDSIPPQGFYPQPSVTFGHARDLPESDMTRFFPVSNTCANTIRLPILDSYDDFSKNMLAAIEMAKTFTTL